MKIEKMAAIANVVAVFPGLYCAYGTWLLLHSPQTAQSSQQAAAPAPSLSGLLVAFLSLVGLVILAAVLNAFAAWRKPHGLVAPTPVGNSKKREGFTDNPNLELVRGKTFRNETVELDGKRFENCEFINTRIEFHGVAPMEFIDCGFGETLLIGSDDPAINHFMKVTEIIRSSPTIVKFACVSVDEHGSVKETLSSETHKVLPAKLNLSTRILALCKEMRAYLKEVGPEPHWDGPHGSNPDWPKWTSNVLLPWKDRFHAGYMLRFNDRVVRMRHELAEKGLRDGNIDSVINVDVHSESMVRQMIEALITLGAKLDD